MRVRIPTGAAGESSSPGDSFCIRSLPVLPQWHIKGLGHSAKSAGRRLHINRHAPLTQRNRSGLTMLSRHSVRTCQGNKVTRNSSGKTRLQLSQLDEPLWTDSGLNSGTGVRKLISTFFLLFFTSQTRKSTHNVFKPWCNVVCLYALHHARSLLPITVSLPHPHLSPSILLSSIPQRFCHPATH